MWRYHQDARSRKPDAAFRNLATSYVQLGIAVGPHTRDTGGMQVLPRSHAAGRDFGIEEAATAMGLSLHGGDPPEAYDELLRRVGADPAALVHLDAAPGDVVAWGPYVIHGGGLNTTPGCLREFYINGYIRAADCDRGHVAWADGAAVPLGPPVLVQMDNFAETAAAGGVYFDADVTGLSDRDIERLRSITTVRD